METPTQTELEALDAEMARLDAVMRANPDPRRHRFADTDAFVAAYVRAVGARTDAHETWQRLDQRKQALLDRQHTATFGLAVGDTVRRKAGGNVGTIERIHAD